MAALTWNETDRNWQTGVDHVAMCINGTGEKLVAWNGVSSITESPQGAEVTAIYADNIKYLNLTSVEDFKASIECYTYPAKFEECIGISSVSGLKIPQQKHKTFGLMFRTKKIDSSDDEKYLYHFIYNCRVGVADTQYQTINDSPEAMTFSYDIQTLPYSEALTGDLANVKSFAHLTVEPTGTAATEALEALWDGNKAFPTPNEVLTAASTSASASASAS